MKIRSENFIAEIFFATVMLVVLLGIYYPLTQIMPSYGLDAGWAYAMNEAIATKKRIGTEIIFTFGPYAHVYTQMYHPATEKMMLAGSAYLIATTFFLISYNALNSKKIYFSVLFFVASFFANMDAVLFAIPLMFCIAIFYHQKILAGKNIYWRKISFFNIAFAATCLGFLPLIKGSILIYVLMVLAVSVAILVFRKSYLIAAIVATFPIVSILFFWQLSGQRIEDIFHYATSLMPIIFGYSPAMGKVGSQIEEAVYVLLVIGVCFSLAKETKALTSEKLYLLISIFLYSFFCFKAGYTRHDGHGYIAMFALIFLFLALNPVISTNHRKRKIGITITISVIFFFLMYFKYGFNDSHFKKIMAEKNLISKATKGLPLSNKIKLIKENFSTEEIFEISKTSFSFKNFWPEKLFKHQNNNDLFLKSNKEIIRQCGFNFYFNGSVDVFTVHQECALANNWIWNPRPIFQSYSAYSPALLKTNQSHFSSKGAPDNVIFQLHVIDGRLPSAEDGLSQFELIRGYKLVEETSDSLLLKKMPVRKNLTLEKKSYLPANFGQEISLPSFTGPLFMTIDVSPSLIDIIFGVLYKNNPLFLYLTLEDGERKRYRIVPNMTETPFIVSPNIDNLSDFKAVLINPSGNSFGKKPVSIRIDTDQPKIGRTPSFGISLFQLRQS